MAIDRRDFISRAAIGIAAMGISPAPLLSDSQTGAAQDDLKTWEDIRSQFDLSRDYIHLASFLLASHPRPVRDAIEKYRRELDANPVILEEYFFNPEKSIPARINAAAADYVGGKPDQIAITNCTTMGLALVYAGLPLKAGQEMLTTEHDHFVHHESIRLAALKTGATMRKVALYDLKAPITEDSIVNKMKSAIRPETRVVGITWVHSSSGVKLPVRKIADVVAEANKTRDESDRIMLVVDGVHGFGIEEDRAAEMGCDFFAAGTHKWMFGPRGTGILWGSDQAWAAIEATIPSFYSDAVYIAWMQNKAPQPPTRASWVTPGGFHPFEHEWAMPEAFEFHKRIGRKRIADRIHALNEQCKEGLAGMKHVRLHTPRGSNLSAGIICFEVDGMKPEDVVHRLASKKIVASVSPYAVSYARVAPSLMNNEAEIERALSEINALK